VAQQPRILVVDDDFDILEMTRTVLAGAGYRVTAVGSGREALRSVREHGFDLVLLDINMPEMDGWETLRLMAFDEETVTPPVVMFSVNSEVRNKVQGMQEGAVDYITKPFAVDDLLARVRRVLEAEGPAGEKRPAALPTT
jgi:DNA-binding response OmpR family regulator